MMKRLLFAVLALIFAPLLADAAKLVKSYSYFTIGGTTFEDIQDQLAKRGPHVNSTGLRHPGATRIKFTTHISYAQDTNHCRIASAKATVKVKVILPRWRKRKKASADVRIFWDTLASDIKRHEERHVEIAKEYGRNLEEALMSMGRQDTCEIAVVKAKKITASVLAKHDKDQARFDRVEAVNFENRILRLLRYRIERIENGRLPG